MLPPRSLLLPACVVLAAVLPAGAAENLLRNGSFEGSPRYWFSKEAAAEKTPTPSGEYCVKLPGGGKAIQSGAFPLERGREVRVSFFVKGETEGAASVSLFPSHREVAQRQQLIWNAQSSQSVKVTTQWQRVSVTFTRDVNPTEGWARAWWPNHTFMLSIGAKQPTWIDGVSVSYEGGDQGYVPRRAVEVVAAAPEAGDYLSDTGGLLARGATVKVRAWAFNASDQPRPVVLRWQVHDYTGARPLGPGIDRKVLLPPGGTFEDSAAVKLEGVGLMLARVSALDEAGQAIDSSDMPLTVLPYPKDAAAPDPTERYGASFRGLRTVQLGQRIGFRWTRWYPHMNWATVQKDGPDQWVWPDAALKELAEHGMTPTVVLWSVPAWARQDKSWLPRDMQWEADDPKWDDLSIETGFDRYVKTIVPRYAGRGYAWELLNEPEVMNSGTEKGLPARQYHRLAQRAARVFRQAGPGEFFMVNSTWAGPTGIYQEFFRAGGAKLIDAFTWHDYSPAGMGDGTKIDRVRQALNAHGGGKVQIWFNEGWSFINSSTDYAALELIRQTPAQSAHAIVHSIVDMAAAGQEKAILFHMGYPQHGKSFWDYCGPGTELWDFAGLPTIGVATWNVLIHHLGKANLAARVENDGARLHVFDDRRNDRGVIVAWSAKGQRTFELAGADLVAEDVMGNAAALDTSGGKTVLKLAADGTPVYVYGKNKTAAADLVRMVQPFDSARAPLATAEGLYRLPWEWTGGERDAAKGNPVEADGRGLWRLDQIWPDDPRKFDNYQSLTWGGTDWTARTHTHGGQPAASVVKGTATLSVRGPAPGQPGEKLAALVFIAPKPGEYELQGTVSLRTWQGQPPLRLYLLLRDANVVAEAAGFTLDDKAPVRLDGTKVVLQENQELAFVPRVGKANTAGTVKIEGLTLRRKP